MTARLRKAHKYIWLVLAIVMPIIMVFAIKDLAITSPEKDMAANVSIPTENILKVVENGLVKVSLYEDRLEIILKSTLKSSSSIVYAMDATGNKSSLIGQLTTTGIYKFAISRVPKGIIITDDLKNMELTKLSF